MTRMLRTAIGCWPVAIILIVAACAGQPVERAETSPYGGAYGPGATVLSGGIIQRSHGVLNR